jgi:hypothetical protein
MLTRRQILAATALGVTVVPASGLFVTADATSRPVGDAATLHVYDDRFAEGVSFGMRARRLGYSTVAISGDVTSLWYDDLYHRWNAGPTAIAGLTTAGAALCLRMFGADAGLRCIYEGVHRRQEPNATIEHRLRGPVDHWGLAALDGCGARWPELLPGVMAACPIAPAKWETVIVSRGALTQAPGFPGLVSWKLAVLS